MKRAIVQMNFQLTNLVINTSMIPFRRYFKLWEIGRRYGNKLNTIGSYDQHCLMHSLKETVISKMSKKRCEAKWFNGEK